MEKSIIWLNKSKDSKIVFVCGFSPDLERQEIAESLPYILDNYTVIGINRFPKFHKGCEYWWWQDRSGYKTCVEGNVTNERLVVCSGALDGMIQYQQKEIFNCGGARSSKPIKNPVDKPFLVVHKSRELDFGPPYGNSVRLFAGVNSSCGATSLAIAIGAQTIVQVGIDLPKYWDYPYGVTPVCNPHRLDKPITNGRNDLKKLGETAKKRNITIYKTNPDNAIELEYKNIKEFTHGN